MIIIKQEMKYFVKLTIIGNTLGLCLPKRLIEKLELERSEYNNKELIIEEVDDNSFKVIKNLELKEGELIDGVQG